jgi:hypothetical protein
MALLLSPFNHPVSPHSILIPLLLVLTLQPILPHKLHGVEPGENSKDAKIEAKGINYLMLEAAGPTGFPQEAAREAEKEKL